MISFLLPLFKEVSPNAVSWSLVPLGCVTAFLYYGAPTHAICYLFGAGMIFLRMVVGTLDGLIATTFQKSSSRGEVINRIAPEICDMALLMVLAYPYGALGILAMGLCWAVTFFGLIGVVGGKKTVSVGPVGQTDRIAALGLFSILQYLAMTSKWDIDFMYVFLLWVVIGSLITVVLRIRLTLKD